MLQRRYKPNRKKQRWGRTEGSYGARRRESVERGGRPAAASSLGRSDPSRNALGRKVSTADRAFRDPSGTTDPTLPDHPLSLRGPGETWVSRLRTGKRKQQALGEKEEPMRPDVRVKPRWSEEGRVKGGATQT